MNSKTLPPAADAAPAPAPRKTVKKKAAAPKAAAAETPAAEAPVVDVSAVDAPAVALEPADKAKGKKKDKDKDKDKKHKKAKKAKKEAVIIRFDDEQLPLIDSRADALSLSRAAWVRMVVARALAE